MNTFSASAPTEPGNCRFTVYAYDPKTGNAGVDGYGGLERGASEHAVGLTFRGVVLIS